MNKIKIIFITILLLTALIALIFIKNAYDPKKEMPDLKKEIIKNDSLKPPNEYNCIPAIENHNDMNQKRINIVFAGFNYQDFENYKFIVESSVDQDSNNYGILSVEPFKSNKDKFNFWYVDKIEHMEPINRALIGIKLMNLKCNFSITHPIGLLNAPASDSKISTGSYGRYTTIGIRENKDYQTVDCSKYDLNNDACIDIKDAELKKKIKKTEDKNFTLCINSAWGCDFETVPDAKTLPYSTDMRLLLHEFGHGFGLLGDEYVTKTAALHYPQGEEYFAGNCYPAGSEEECLKNAPWNNLIKGECNEKTEFNCNSDINIKVGCYEGCANFIKGVYRPTKTSIMNIPGKPFSYGAVNERLLCERMNEILDTKVC